jgi:hypothetical protein
MSGALNRGQPSMLLNPTTHYCNPNIKGFVQLIVDPITLKSPHAQSIPQVPECPKQSADYHSNNNNGSH